jgi:long-chain acyl-CoA synthetase
LPRTEGTRKLKRRELRSWLTGQRKDAPAQGAAPADSRHTVAAILERFAPGRTIGPSTTIDELGLTSLERVELMMALEEAFQVTVEETAFSAAATVADLEAIVKPPDWGQTPRGQVTGSDPAVPGAGVRPRTFVFPAWNRSLPARIARRVSLPTWILPLSRIWARVTVTGLEHLAAIDGPVIFAANHQSHFDGPVILDALPPRWRYRTAPAMMREFFGAHFFPERHTRLEWFTNSLNYYLSALFFNAFPLTQGTDGTRQTLRYIGTLVGAGYSILIFPEGRRSEAGEISRFQPGVGMIAARLGVPVVPVRVDGLNRVLPRHASFPVVARARVTFGAPIVLTGNDYAALAATVEAVVRTL